MSRRSAEPSSFKDWMKKKFTYDALKDMVNFGVKGGFSGLIYYRETLSLYEEYHEEIWAMLTEDTEQMGCKCPLELIATFSGAADVESHKKFVNLLVWYMAERIALSLTEEAE